MELFRFISLFGVLAICQALSVVKNNKEPCYRPEFDKGIEEKM